MPRKTKKQKIIATYRKKLQLLKNRQELPSLAQSAPAVIITKKIPLLTPIKSGLIAPIDGQNQYDILLKTRTLADLKKTLIIAVFVLAFEFLIFYAKLKDIQQFLIFHF